MYKHLISAAAAVAVLGSGLTAAVVQAATPAAASVRDAPTYVMMAGASDLYEIQSSQMVMESTQNDKVRGFAQMMVSDHTNTTQQVTAAAQAAGMSPPPPQLTPDQAKMLQDLQAANGADRDRLYVKQQVMAHQMALKLHQSYASHGDHGNLIKVANTAVPIVQHHLTEIMQIQRSVH